MKRIFSSGIVILVVLIFSCGSYNNKEKATDENSEVSEKSTFEGTIKITKLDFLEKVMNYEKNSSTWKYEGSLPCLIDFYADWCAPCRITEPILEELAREYYGRIYIYKVDIQREQELASIFRVQSIPAFLFCPMTGQPKMSTGIARTPDETKAMFKQMIEEYLLKNY